MLARQSYLHRVSAFCQVFPHLSERRQPSATQRRIELTGPQIDEAGGGVRQLSGEAEGERGAGVRTHGPEGIIAGRPRERAATVGNARDGAEGVGQRITSNEPSPTTFGTTLGVSAQITTSKGLETLR